MQSAKGAGLRESVERATAAMCSKWDRERDEAPAALYDFTYHIEFGGGRKLGLKLRTDNETGLWVKSFLDGWPSVDSTFSFVPAKDGE